ncbi:DUF3853 family protein [Flavobacterium petrolei]|uniref:DUF3853 family protein n=1 Tax=Flavobacterium petrolei TaxID=2259594 RepID=UPI0037570EF2
MEIQELLKKPLFQLTTEEFLFVNKRDSQSTITATTESTTPIKTYVYGLSGIATLFGCSIATASRIKGSGKIEDAISQEGRKIVVDAELALKLSKSSNKRRKQTK